MGGRRCGASSSQEISAIGRAYGALDEYIQPASAAEPQRIASDASCAIKRAGKRASAGADGNHRMRGHVTLRMRSTWASVLTEQAASCTVH